MKLIIARSLESSLQAQKVRQGKAQWKTFECICEVVTSWEWHGEQSILRLQAINQELQRKGSQGLRADESYLPISVQLSHSEKWDFMKANELEISRRNKENIRVSLSQGRSLQASWAKKNSSQHESICISKDQTRVPAQAISNSYSRQEVRRETLLQLSLDHFYLKGRMTIWKIEMTFRNSARRTKELRMNRTVWRKN